MSMKVKLESIAVTVDVTPKFEVITVLDPKDVQTYLANLVEVLDQMLDRDWDKLTDAEQQWLNSGIKALESKAEISYFPDEVVEVEVLENVGEVLTVEIVKVGDDVDITLTDDKKTVCSGKVVEKTERLIILDDADKEIDVRICTIASITFQSSKEVVNEPVEIISKGETVEAGAAVEGRTYSIESDNIVVEAVFIRATSRGAVFEDADGERYRTPVNQDIVEIVKKAPIAAGVAEESKDVKQAPQKKDKPMSVHLRAKHLICENITWSVEQVKDQLVKEEYKCADSTLTNNYKDVHLVLSILTEQGLLK